MKILLVLTIIIVLGSPFLVLAQQQSPGNCSKATTELCNPLNGKATNLTEFLDYAMAYAGTLIGLMAICILVYSGVRIIMANGDEKAISSGKAGITYGIAGFVISVLAYVIVIAIENFIGVKQTQSTEPAFFNPFAANSLQGFLTNILSTSLVIFGTLAMLMIVLNGFRYVTARGDEHQVEKAKTGLTWSLIGLAVIIFAYVIVASVAHLLGK